MSGQPDPAIAAWQALNAVGVEQAVSYPTSGPKVISLHIDLGSWSWDGSAEAIPRWVGDFARDPIRADNIRKLSEADGEAHLASVTRQTGSISPLASILSHPYGSMVPTDHSD